MTSSRRNDWLDFWERRELKVLTGLPYVLLALCTGFDLVDGGGGLLELAIAVAAAALMAVTDLRDRRTSWTAPRSAPRTGPAALTFLVLIGLGAALVISQPLFGFYVFTGYFWAWRLLEGRARFLGVALVAATVAISQTGSGPYDNAGQIGVFVAVYLVNLGVAGTLTWFAWIGEEQHDRRGRELDELTRAHAELERMMRENSELQQQLVTQARDAGVEQERRRMAREIHDTIAQGLTGIVTQLQAAQRAGGSISAGAAADHLETAIELARSSLTEARRSVQALAPEPLADARLPDAMQDVAGRWSALHELPVTVTTTGSARSIRPELEVALLRTAQEALANVAKHAHATRVGLTLSYMEDQVMLDIRDDGIGFQTVNGSRPRGPRDDGGGFGLTSMRQRIEGVLGTLEIESEPDGGTAISASVPAVSA
ncbi:MAG TPA: sensor histidine kinase [Solirubrobacteraceae bacterium]|nr:sensor histidine kinase [Solirubrobacteraceae bacterium]